MLRGRTDTYEILELVARGRSGDLYRGVDEAGRSVALKMHHRADDGRDEAHRLGLIDHEAVVCLLDRGLTDLGQIWLAMPWIDGQTLSAFLASEAPVPLDRARAIITRLAGAIDELHRVGVVHGDLSPNNVIIGPDDEVTLIDLGASTSADQAAIDETTGLDVTVTPRYAAPEIALGKAALPASDHYALALIAYELVTGAFPLPDVATPIAMLAHHASTEPVAPSEHRPDLPTGIDHALLVGLSKDPADRHRTAADLVAAMAHRRAPRPAAMVERIPFAGARHRGVAAAAVTGLVLAGAAVIAGPALFTTPAGDDRAASAPWPAGRAAGLSCNVLIDPGFDAQASPPSFYGGDPTNTTALASGAGVDGSAALRVGAAGTFGLFGETVPAVADREHVFSLWIRREGDVETSGVYIDFLDQNYRQLTAERDLVSVGETVGDTDGGRIVVRATAPRDAAFAVPTIFKDGSNGSLLVDETVFGLSEACPDLTS